MNADGSSAEGIEVAPGVRVAASAIRYQFSRSGGPGGQNVNKLNTKTELWVAVSDLRGLRDDTRQRLRSLAGSRLTQADEIHIVAEEQRTQEGNRETAMRKLRELLIQAMHRPKRRRATRPTRGSIRRRLDDKRRRGDVKRQRQGGD